MRRQEIAILFLSLVIAFSCNRSEVAETEAPAPVEIKLSTEQQEGAGIEISRAEERRLSGVLSCNGRIETPPSSRAKVSTLMNGYIKEISIHDGKFVNKGEVIAILEHPDFLQLQSDYLMEKSRYGFLNLDYERQLKLNEQNINSNKEFQRVKSEWEQSGIRLGSLKSKLEMLRVDIDKISATNISPLFTIKAPISGYCEGISIALGQFVRPDEIVVEVVNRVEFLIVLQVFEKDIASVLPGQSVSFLCPDPGSQVVSHLGKVIYSGQKIDETSRTFQVYASPNEDYENMRHGMMIRANIELSGVSVLTVPVEALVYSDQGEFLFIREGEIFRPVKVQTGLKDSGYVEIVNRNDIDGKDIVLKGGVYLLAEMQKE